MEFITKTRGDRVYVSKIQVEFEKKINSITDDKIKPIVVEILEYLIDNSGEIYNIKKPRLKSLLFFIDEIKDKQITEVTWSYLCEMVNKNYKVAKFCSIILMHLLDNNLYDGEFREKLLSLRDLFDMSYSSDKTNDIAFAKHYIGDDIVYRHFISDVVNNERNIRYYLIKTKNTDLWHILKEFCDKANYTIWEKKELMSFFEHIGESLGIYENTIKDISGFNYNTFREQIKYYKQFKNAKELLLILNKMYIFFIEHPSEKGSQIFKDTDDMELNVLKRDDFAQKIIEGYLFHYYNPIAPIPNNDKWILHINGFDENSTKATDSMTIAYDFTKIKSSLYRKLIKRMIWIDTSITFIVKYDFYNQLIELFNFIYEFKKQDNYPNPDLRHFNIFEAIIIRKHIDNLYNTQSTKAHYLYAIKKFFKVQEDNKEITFEILFFDYLKNFTVLSENNAEAIPIEDLAQIDNTMKKNAHESYFNSLCYSILHLSLQTEFRISQICKLKANCLVPTMKDNQFQIKTKSKTSNGQEYNPTISNLTKAHLDDIIMQSKTVRAACTEKNIKNNIFIYKSQQNRYKTVTASDFRKFFTLCCEEAGIKRYTPSNLRDTRMTQAEEYRMRHGESDAILSILSGHKRVDTTHNHYIETELIKMLESTYGIIFGDVDITGEIVEKINDEINNKEHSVEYGCGFCKKDSCGIFNSISCLMCKDFITTLEHEKDFRDYISKIDSMISTAPTEHDKEDLVNIKRLYCTYLLEILKKKGAAA